MKISIIVPVYNVENNLIRCLESIINQTYKNLEIILVDDGSTDNSGYICDQFEKKDKRIKTIHKKNGGVSSTRNLGIEMASGDYISFVDSDDYIELCLYEKVVNTINKDKSDIVIFNFIRETEDGKIINKIYHHKITQSVLKFSRDNYINSCYKYPFIDLFIWNKVYSKNIVKNDNFQLKFNEAIYMSEDALFNVDIVDKNKKIVCTYINENLYHYVMGNTSFTSQKLNPKKLTYLDEKRIEINLLKQNKLDINIPMTCYIIFFCNNWFLFDSVFKKKEYEEWFEEYRDSLSLLKVPIRLKIKYYQAIFFYNLKKKGE